MNITLLAAAEPDPDDAAWTVSSTCLDNACVEVAFHGGGVRVRDTTGTTLQFTGAEWVAFLGGVKLGEFEGPGR